MVGRIAVAGLIAASVVTSAASQELPRFDVERHCYEVASFSGPPSETIRKGCFDMEQAAYNALKGNWPELPSAMRRHCVEIATFTPPGSYSILQGCVQMEQSAGQQNRTRKFNY